MQQAFNIGVKAIVLGDGGKAVPSRIQVLRVGSFSHPFYGDFEITKETLKTLQENFKSDVRKTKLAVDFSHRSEDIAAGWFSDVGVSDNGEELWADVEWTPKGKEALINKEFAYISADFVWDYEDAESKTKHGPTLMGAGLTNRPFVKGMQPAAELTEKPLNGGSMTLDEAKKEIEGLKAENLKLSEEIKKRDEKIAADEKKAQEEKVLAEKKSAFDKMLSEGKVVEAQRPAYMSGDVNKFIELAEKPNMTAQGTGKTEGEENTTGSAEDEIVKLAEGLVSEKKAVSFAAARKMIFADPKHAELVKKFHKEQGR